ncbi:ornithine aminomutase subunit alpha [Tepidibacter formicigenes]|uniref:D-ornithine 4,5-aminomutase S subunit n=1 Tax=Tepidibacter formicigenes DSM 15518 TaxID=1123349 RepID=A0A1M6MUK5_9FIRM|nr:ornithine aminomutase subunit alpha [Tepidibacter formicigenes]SHJ87080.1 D-ornithine 4,5-aminomutase S subunit [Tepidibacter formicigenes DSM 15518]
MKRADDFNERRKHLANLSDEELYKRFWELAEKIVEPMLELAKNNTTPSVERSILLRMGFSSLEAKPLVEGAIDRGLISKGVGHIVYRVSRDKNIPIRQAGLEMIEGNHWDYAMEIFKKENADMTV